MARRTITTWLKTWQRKYCAFTFGLAVLALVVGLAVLLVTFWLAYVVIVLGMEGISAGSVLLSGKQVGLSHGWRLTLGLAFIVLLFMSAARADREHPLQPRSENFKSRDLAFLSGRLRAELSIVAHPIGSARMISFWLCMGPRWVFGSARLFSRSLRLLRLQSQTLGPVLEFMTSKPSSVSKDELLQAFPRLLWADLVSDLALIDGILFLNADMTRLTLSDSLRELLA